MLVFDVSNWNIGIVVESIPAVGADFAVVQLESAPNQVPVLIEPDPSSGMIVNIPLVAYKLLIASLFADASFWQAKAQKLKHDKVFLNDIRAVPALAPNHDKIVQYTYGIAKAHNRSITSRYALAFTTFVRPNIPQDEKDPIQFNPRMAWFGRICLGPSWQGHKFSGNCCAAQSSF